MSLSKRLIELGMDLPGVVPPVASYVPGSAPGKRLMIHPVPNWKATAVPTTSMFIIPKIAPFSRATSSTEPMPCRWARWALLTRATVGWASALR